MPSANRASACCEPSALDVLAKVHERTSMTMTRLATLAIHGLAKMTDEDLMELNKSVPNSRKKSGRPRKHSTT